MVSQWSKTAWGKACPEVAALSVEVNPKDSMTGRYAFKLKIGVPAPKRLFITLQQKRNFQQRRAQTESAGVSYATRQGFSHSLDQTGAISSKTCLKLLSVAALRLHQVLQYHHPCIVGRLAPDPDLVAASPQRRDHASG